MNLETARTALLLLRGEEDFAWVSIIESTGSSPRHLGAHMLVRADGSIVGTVGGGALEAYAIGIAGGVLSSRASRLAPYSLDNNDAVGLGMICGGQGLLLVEYVDHADPTMTGVFEAAVDLLSDGGRGALVTLCPQDPAPGRGTHRCVVLERDGSIIGSEACVELGTSALSSSGTLVEVKGETMRLYVERLGAHGTAFVFGAGHCGRSLVPVLHAVGFRTVVVDDRADYASPERFPQADSLVVPPSFEGVMGGLLVDDDSYVIIVTRGHLHDRSVLKQALQTPARYVGMIGSRRKVAQTLEALSEEGVDAGRLERVHAPIGLPIGAETPEEIAVSIAAELIQVRARSVG